jgi:hypothetical protein
MPSNLEPLLPDARVARIERAVRLRYPLLPPEATFVTYYQEPTTRVTDDGLELPVEAQAVFGILIPNPRHPQFEKMILGRAPMSIWERDEREYRHSTEIAADQAYHSFLLMAPQAVEWYQNTLALI